MSIIVSNSDSEKLLAIPILEQGTAKNQALMLYETLVQWNINKSVKALSFDTTAVNSGHLGGTCVLLERLLEKELLYLPCRHHIFEIILRSIFDNKISCSTGKDVLIFKRFQQAWNNLNKENFKPHIFDSNIKEMIEPELQKIIIFVENNLNTVQPRNDYKEFLELTLIFLGVKSHNSPFFHKPGAIHHARWMAKAIYSLKIYLFRDEFKLNSRETQGLRDVCLFLVLVYVDSWFTATSAIAAPYNDLNFVKKLYNYRLIDSEISQIALSKFINHLWYLSPQSMGLAFFDNKIDVNIKRKMVAQLNSTPSQTSKRLKLNESDIADFVKKDIEYFSKI
ncbi:uncharacterized protein LOC126907801 isoform X1 [Daktulosphaira vitifoliae]|uniref:uncharacterized protein LOC126907801 isoform X1 n=1 Tax=Daktulosphaira vitifoliae TaxID=58002 RepID=UPI0021A9F226|nr:uncharacterized protein LOC126907801 isoform X1 [Daktulosphaira vitifoliae]